MKKLLKLVGLSYLLFWQVAWSQEVSGDNLKVGFVNVRQLMARAPQITQIQQRLTKEFENENQRIITLRNEIAQLTIRYNGNEGDASQVELQKEIDSKQQEMLNLQQKLKDTYNLRRNEALGKLQTLIVRMIAKVSQEKQLDLVLNNTGVVYVSGRIDITPFVFKYLKEERVE